MTREEAIQILRDTPIDIRSTREDDIHTLYATAQMMAIEALKADVARWSSWNKTFEQSEIADLISRADAIEEISKGVWNVYELIDRINTLPSADRPQGEWVDAGQYPFDKCSICGQTVDSYDKWNFCPNCGARMRGAE